MILRGSIGSWMDMQDEDNYNFIYCWYCFIVYHSLWSSKQSIWVKISCNVINVPHTKTFRLEYSFCKKHSTMGKQLRNNYFVLMYLYFGLGHGRLPVNLTVSFIARKWTDLNNWRHAIIVRPSSPQQSSEMSRTITFQIYKGEREVGNMPNIIEKE